MATTIPNADWTPAFHQKIINHGKSGGLLTTVQVSQLKAAVKAGNKGADSQDALDKAHPDSFK